MVLACSKFSKDNAMSNRKINFLAWLPALMWAGAAQSLWWLRC